MSKTKLVRATVDDKTYKEIDLAARKKNWGISLFLRVLLGEWAAGERAKREQAKREAEEGKEYGC